MKEPQHEKFLPSSAIVISRTEAQHQRGGVMCHMHGQDQSSAAVGVIWTGPVFCCCECHMDRISLLLLWMSYGQDQSSAAVGVIWPLLVCCCCRRDPSGSQCYLFGIVTDEWHCNYQSSVKSRTRQMFVWLIACLLSHYKLTMSYKRSVEALSSDPGPYGYQSAIQRKTARLSASSFCLSI